MNALLQLGAIGLPVVDLQELLTLAGLPVAVDGWFGPETDAALRQAQAGFELLVDGVAGDATLHALRDGAADPRHLTEADAQAAATVLDVPLATLKALIAVLATGPGFMPSGRPALLVERDAMYRALQAAGKDADALAARYPLFVNPQRGGYAGGPTEWHRYQSASHMDADCALVATRWGMFAMLGEHWQRVGFDSPNDFANAMATSEGEQLAALARYIKADPAMLKALKAKKWADFARAYDGDRLAYDAYDLKLGTAFDRANAQALAAQPADVAEATA